MEFEHDLHAASARRTVQWAARLSAARNASDHDANGRNALNSSISVIGRRNVDLAEAYARANDLVADASLLAEFSSKPIDPAGVEYFIAAARQSVRGLERDWQRFRDARGIAALEGENQLADMQQRLIDSHIEKCAVDLRLHFERAKARIQLAEQVRIATEAQVDAARQAHRAATWQFWSAMIAIIALLVSILAVWKQS